MSSSFRFPDHTGNKKRLAAKWLVPLPPSGCSESRTESERMASTKKRRRKSHATKSQDHLAPQSLPVSRSLVSRIAHSAWGPSVSLLLGAVVSISGARSQEAVDVLLGVAVIWTFWVVATLPSTKQLRALMRVTAISATVIALALAWWLLARGVFVVTPSPHIPTAPEIARALRAQNATPELSVPTKPNDQRTTLPGAASIAADHPVPTKVPTPTNKDQTRLLEEQNKLLEAQFRPVFRFVQGRRSVGGEEFDFLEVWNDGAPMLSYRIWEGSYIQVTRNLAPPRPPFFETRLIPSTYLSRREFNGDAKAGLLTTYYAWRDYPGTPICNKTKEFGRLDAEVRARYKSQVIIAKRVFLEIYYATRARAANTEIFELYPPERDDTRPSAPIKLEGVRLSMNWDRDLKTITADNLFDGWNGDKGLLQQPYKYQEIMEKN